MSNRRSDVVRAQKEDPPGATAVSAAEDPVFAAQVSATIWAEMRSGVRLDLTPGERKWLGEGGRPTYDLWRLLRRALTNAALDIHSTHPADRSAFSECRKPECVYRRTLLETTGGVPRE